MKKNEEREPRFQYDGTYAMFITEAGPGEPLVVGDTAWDCDYGDIKWNGKEWKQYNPHRKPYTPKKKKS